MLLSLSRGCSCLRCTNKADSANYRRVWHPAIPTQPPNYLPTEATEPTEVYDARYSPTDCTDVHRLGGYGILAIPTQTPNYLPTEPTEPTEVSGARYSPTDCTDVHRLGGYGIPAIPTQPPNYLSTEPTEFTEAPGARYSPTEHTEPTETTGGEEKSVCICEIRGRLFYASRSVNSVKSVGGSSLPETSVNSVNSVGEPYAATKLSVLICAICGRIIKWAAWVWQGCHTLLSVLCWRTPPWGKNKEGMAECHALLR